MSIKYWNYPNEIFCGVGAGDLIASRCKLHGVNRPLVVADSGVMQLQPFKVLRQNLEAHDVHFCVFSEFESNPTFEDAHEGAKHYLSGGHDGLIAMGGGSAIDVSKAIAMAACDSDGLEKYEWNEKANRYPTISDHPVLKLPVLIAVPTTAGTGSELGRDSVLTDSSLGVKKVIGHPEMLPKDVILDPLMLVGLPAKLTAATGMDALTHHLEAYFSPLCHPMSSGIAMEGITLVKEHLATAVSDGTNLDAREGMLVASASAGLAFQKGLGAVHALAHPLGGRYHLHHGLLNAILLPYVLLANRQAIETKAVKLARLLDLANPSFDSLLNWVIELRENVGIPNALSDLGLNTADAKWVGEQALADTSSSDTNPILFTAEQYSQIFIAAVEGRRFS